MQRASIACFIKPASDYNGTTLSIGVREGGREGAGEGGREGGREGARDGWREGGM